MESGFSPFWDERGDFRRGCTVREALAWFTQFGGHSPGEIVSVNGVAYKIGRLLYGHEHPEVADQPLAGVFDGYYHQLCLRV